MKGKTREEFCLTSALKRFEMKNLKFSRLTIFTANRNVELLLSQE
jgi:hypothetical protein